MSSSSELLSNNSLFVGQLQNRSNHEREARVIYLLTTDRQTVNYYATIHARVLIYFVSNTQETMKKQFINTQLTDKQRFITQQFTH